MRAIDTSPSSQGAAPNPRSDWRTFCELIRRLEPGFAGYRVEPNYFRGPGADYSHVSLGHRADGIAVQIVFESPREAGADAAGAALQRELNRVEPGRELRRRDLAHRTVLSLFEPFDVARAAPSRIMDWYLHWWPVFDRYWRERIAGSHEPGARAPRTPMRPYLERALREQETELFRPAALEDTRMRAARDIVSRRGQGAFRAGLLAAYGGRCAVSACDAEAALEAAHIYPYMGEAANHPSNGLLLRADLHTLLDPGLITVRAEGYAVAIASELRRTVYGELAGRVLRLPGDGRRWPSREALAWHNENVFLG